VFDSCPLIVNNTIGYTAVQ